MKSLSYIDLLSPYPIYIDGVGYAKPLTIAYIIQNYIKYQQSLNTLCLTVNQFFKINDQEDFYNSLSVEQKIQLNMYDLWLQSNEGLKILIDSLLFFINGSIVFDSQNMFFIVYDENNNMQGVINNDNFNFVCDCIKKINYINTDAIISGKPKNKKAAEILAKLNKAMAKTKEKENENLDLPNIISALCVQHNSYNMTNIWSLTIYQLYDQFYRQNLKNQIDTFATRWSTWGKEQFDFKQWFKSMK